MNDDRELFEERAAIREFDGCMDRDLAEALAKWDVREWRKQQMGIDEWQPRDQVTQSR